MFKTFETTLAGRPLVIETGKMAMLANGHCLVRYGDTVVMPVDSDNGNGGGESN